MPTAPVRQHRRELIQLVPSVMRCLPIPVPGRRAFRFAPLLFSLNLATGIASKFHFQQLISHATIHCHNQNAQKHQWCIYRARHERRNRHTVALQPRYHQRRHARARTLPRALWCRPQTCRRFEHDVSRRAPSVTRYGALALSGVGRTRLPYALIFPLQRRPCLFRAIISLHYAQTSLRASPKRFTHRHALEFTASPPHTLWPSYGRGQSRKPQGTHQKGIRQTHVQVKEMRANAFLQL